MSTLIDALKALREAMLAHDHTDSHDTADYCRGFDDGGKGWAGELSKIIAEQERCAEPDDVKALAEFTDYVVRNYPPQTFISDPNWHAPKLFRAAKYAIESSRQPLPKGAA